MTQHTVSPDDRTLREEVKFKLGLIERRLRQVVDDVPPEVIDDFEKQDKTQPDSENKS